MPVGAVVVMAGEIVAAGDNAPISTDDPTAHAEMRAIREAAAKLGNYRLEEATLYVTLEPCVMCAGALVAARVSGGWYSAPETCASAACAASSASPIRKCLNHRVEVVEGVRAVECVQALQEFFAARRANEG